MKRALFRCDASVSLGIGHVMRCLAFADTLRWAGWSCGFATNREAAAMVPALADRGYEIRTADARINAALAIVDHYGLDAKFERDARERGASVVVFDDLADRAHDCAILLDPTPGRRASDYQAHVPNDSRLMLGPKHAILGEGWVVHRGASRSRLAVPRPVARIIVSMGGTDAQGATLRVLDTLATAKLNVHVDVILGPGAPHRNEIARRVGPLLALHVDPPDLPALAAAADLAIGAPGTSSFERAVLGLPAILIPLADNQRFVAAAFAEANAAEIVPFALLDEPQALGARIAAISNDGARRAAMSRNAAALTDGRGRFRLLAAISGTETTRAGASVRLRLAEAEDERWLLDLQSQEATRRYSNNPAVPSTAEHAAWFGRVLDDPQRLLMITEADGAACGMVRIDRVADETSFEISIAIDSARHGEGLGGAALALVRRLAPGADLIATVKTENAPSLKLFAAAGYDKDGSERYRSRAA